MTDTYLIGGEALLPGGVLAAVDIRVADGVIAEIGTDLRLDPRAEVVENRGFAMPGLIDAHTHLSWVGTAPMPSTLEGVRQRVRENRRALLDAGVTTIRDVGAIAGALDESSEGPRTFAANQLVCAVGGHGTETAIEWGTLPKLAWEARGSAEFRAGVRAQVEGGARLVKITLNSAELEVTQEEATAAVEEAHRLGVRVACHASIPQAIDIAIDAGVDTIEHGNGASVDQLRRMAQSGIVLVPTLWIFERFLTEARRLDAEGSGGRAWPPPVAIWQARVDAHRPIVRAALNAGVTLAAGTDGIGGCDAASITDELLALHEHGLTPIEALRAATEGGAAALGMSDIGVLSVGAVADIVAFDHSPHEVVTGRRRAQSVLQGGHRVV